MRHTKGQRRGTKGRLAQTLIIIEVPHAVFDLLEDVPELHCNARVAVQPLKSRQHGPAHDATYQIRYMLMVCFESAYLFWGAVYAYHLLRVGLEIKIEHSAKFC